MGGIRQLRFAESVLSIVFRACFRNPSTKRPLLTQVTLIQLIYEAADFR